MQDMILKKLISAKKIFEKMNLILEKPKYLKLTFSVFRLILQNAKQLLFVKNV